MNTIKNLLHKLLFEGTTPLPADVDYKIVLLKFLLYLLSQRPPSRNDLALKCKMSPRYNKYSPQSTSINT